MSKYTQRKDNEGWEEKSGVPFKLACCDCGLVHQVVIVAGRKGSKIGVADKRQDEAAKGCARLILEDEFNITPKKKP